MADTKIIQKLGMLKMYGIKPENELKPDAGPAPLTIGKGGLRKQRTIGDQLVIAQTQIPFTGGGAKAPLGSANAGTAPALGTSGAWGKGE